MKDRILQFLESQRISPAEFADKIGVQRSSMSHILNGRNYPSAAFIQKMLQAYPLVNSRWLMIGDGDMNMEATDTKSSSDKQIGSRPEIQITEAIKDNGLQTKFESLAETGSLFPEGDKDPLLADQNNTRIQASDNQENKLQNQIELQVTDSSAENAKEERGTAHPPSFPPGNVEDKEIEQVLFFYKDKTFSVYRPS